MKQSLALAILAIGMSLGTATVLAQSNNNNGGPGGGRGGRNFDPAQRQQWMMDRIKERLEIKDDAEWSALQPRVQKVVEIEQQMMSDRMRGMFGGRSRGGDNASGDQSQGRSRFGFGGQASPESEALQKAIDAKASKAEIQAALKKYQESRKAKQAELEKAQEDLRKVLTSRQEAIATMSGLL